MEATVLPVIILRMVSITAHVGFVTVAHLEMVGVMVNPTIRANVIMMEVIVLIASFQKMVTIIVIVMSRFHVGLETAIVMERRMDHVNAIEMVVIVYLTTLLFLAFLLNYFAGRASSSLFSFKYYFEIFCQKISFELNKGKYKIFGWSYIYLVLIGFKIKYI